MRPGAVVRGRRARRRPPPTIQPVLPLKARIVAMGCVAMSIRYSPLAFSCTVALVVTRSRLVTEPVITRVLTFWSAGAPPSAWTYFATTSSTVSVGTEGPAGSWGPAPRPPGAPGAAGPPGPPRPRAAAAVAACAGVISTASAGPPRLGVAVVARRAAQSLLAVEEFRVHVRDHLHHVARDFLWLLVVQVRLPLHVAVVALHAQRRRDVLHRLGQLFRRDVLEDLDVLGRPAAAPSGRRHSLRRAGRRGQWRGRSGLLGAEVDAAGKRDQQDKRRGGQQGYARGSAGVTGGTEKVAEGTRRLRPVCL